MTDNDASGSHILITGAAGFIGQALAAALLQEPSVTRIVLTDVVAPTAPPSSANTADKHERREIHTIAADLTSPTICQKLFTPDLTHVYLLHGIMSGATEANLELGLKVNLDSIRHILDVLRGRDRPARVVFPSSLAVFGPSDGVVVSEQTMPLPQSSYGAQKSMVEILLNDFSRRRLIDARIVRLPTIIVRPGKRTGAASSFCSGIIREPLNGEQAILPVRKDLSLWVCSARTVIRNLVIAGMRLTGDDFGGNHRIVNLPGVTTTVQQMLDALAEVGGQKAMALVKDEYDEKVSKIVSSWPAIFDITRAIDLGFQHDCSLEQTLRDYIADYLS
ncbi:NAD(P)-binding protein [Cryphonectria parasitica EP155]|uniref:NAD(P)-binding protein n=1 Tax=Cryphonectria parasitica (strain ATCC 38755 / EP155) TaxID=660469 RepID=A0A9P5CHE8_CRYP1|nr:NAD(P)-binding protein [Cryphonectria parasitica EP155]KAF3759933.1 NAD(P)-binding protein [Cryphonectria parasitica EP155]